MLRIILGVSKIGNGGRKNICRIDFFPGQEITKLNVEIFQEQQKVPWRAVGSRRFPKWIDLDGSMGMIGAYP